MDPAAPLQAKKAAEKQLELKTFAGHLGPDKIFSFAANKVDVGTATAKILESGIELPWEFVANASRVLWGFIGWSGDAQAFIQFMDVTGRPEVCKAFQAVPMRLGYAATRSGPGRWPRWPNAAD